MHCRYRLQILYLCVQCLLVKKLLFYQEKISFKSKMIGPDLNIYFILVDSVDLAIDRNCTKTEAASEKDTDPRTYTVLSPNICERGFKLAIAHVIGGASPPFLSLPSSWKMSLCLLLKLAPTCAFWNPPVLKRFFKRKYCKPGVTQLTK